MNENIQRLLTEISELEEELATVIQEQQERLHYRIEGSKIRFEENLRRIHHDLRTGVFSWLRQSELRNIAQKHRIGAVHIRDVYPVRDAGRVPIRIPDCLLPAVPDSESQAFELRCARPS
jgi:hypothetical protein